MSLPDRIHVPPLDWLAARAAQRAAESTRLVGAGVVVFDNARAVSAMSAAEVLAEVQRLTTGPGVPDVVRLRSEALDVPPEAVREPGNRKDRRARKARARRAR